jgi:hypothetical protein
VVAQQVTLKVDKVSTNEKDSKKSIAMSIMTKSRGIGDTIEKITKATGIKKIVEVASKATGQDCGCEERRDSLNRLFPYNNK